MFEVTIFWTSGKVEHDYRNTLIEAHTRIAATWLRHGITADSDPGAGTYAWAWAIHREGEGVPVEFGNAFIDGATWSNGGQVPPSAALYDARHTIPDPHTEG